MSAHPIKAYPTLGCCGLDCGLCPRYYTVGSSRCPGCCDADFFDKHPSCSFITCCVKRKNLEVCAECNEFPCSKFDGWIEVRKDVYDSFLTHRRAIPNLKFIKEHGIEKFLEQQKKRIRLLELMLEHFNEGKSKSFYCIAAALLSITDLEESLKRSAQKIVTAKIGAADFKTRSQILKESLNYFAAGEGMELKLRKNVKTK